MSGRWLCLAVNFFVVGYTLDAGLSLADELLRLATGSMLLLEARNVLAYLVLTVGLLSLPLLWLTPRLPLRLLLPLILSAVWLNTGAMPLPAVIDAPGTLALTAVVLQLTAAGLALLWIRRQNGGSGWLFQPDAFERGPLFSLRHTALFSAGALFVLVPAALAYGFVSVVSAVQLETRGFISFDLTGVSLADRRYVKDDREVRLVGMMHIGEEQAYRELVQSFIEESTIVLSEGVSDDSGALESPLSYEGAAAALGLEVQEELGSYLVDSNDVLPAWPVLRNADVDLSDFSAVTIEWLEWAARLWDGSGSLEAMRELLARSAENEDELVIVEHDIIGLRNQHLLAEIEAALPDYRRVIVPWGALHLPFIERSILERGFDESQREQRRLISWATLLAALF